MSPRPADEGMTLIEVLVAITLFAVMAGSILAFLGGAIRLTRDDRFHMEASTLASRELEITRDAFASSSRGPTSIDTNLAVNPSPLPGGTVGQPLVVDNVPYTVKRTAQWSEVGSTAASTCDAGSSVELSYLRVHVEVTWPGLGSRPPVAMDTVMTPPKGTYSTLTGHIGVKIIDAAGHPYDGMTVTATSAAGTLTESTSSDGCALFAFLTPATYQIKASAPGYVNRNGDPNGTATAQVQAGQLWRTTIEYDRSATITAQLVTDAGYALPSPISFPLVLGNSALLPSGTKQVNGTGTLRTVANLWPFPSGYQVWAGACRDNDPHGGPVTTTSGGTSLVNISLGPVDIQGPPNTVVTGSQVADSSCSGGQSITLGTTGADGKLKTSAPYGYWTFTGGGKSGDATLVSGSSAPSVDLQ